MIGQRGALLLLGASCLFLAAGSVRAQLIATCSGLEGHAYYHYSGLLSKQQSGFEKDRIPDGLTTLQKLGNGEFDILIVDTRKQVISYRNDGGKVVPLRRGTRDATFLVVFPGRVVEIYTIYTDSEGVKRIDLLQSKGGDDLPVHKSSILTGTCSVMNLHLL